jgi:uncharacterized protein with HEPN domain
MWRDEAYLADVVIAARKAVAYARAMDKEAFIADDRTQQAVIHMIQIIGEAARQLSPEFKASHPEVPWSRMVGMRHRLVHEYFNVDVDIVWEVLHCDLPDLIPQIEPLVNLDEHP